MAEDILVSTVISGHHHLTLLTMVVFFILPGVIRANQGIYLAVLFNQPSKKLGDFLPGW